MKPKTLVVEQLGCEELSEIKAGFTYEPPVILDFPDGPDLLGCSGGRCGDGSLAALISDPLGLDPDPLVPDPVGSNSDPLGI